MSKAATAMPRTVPADVQFGPVVRAMRDNLSGGVTLTDMADVACLSPFHFLRAFRHAFGVPPGHFFTALRMDAAKRLLLTTTESVVDVCFSVGYSSPGTFSTRFAHLVGETPRSYRALRDTFMETGIWETGLWDVDLGLTTPTGSSAPYEMGRILGPPGFRGVIFVGTFPLRVPQALPLAGALLREPGPYCLPPVADGVYHVMAAAVPEGEPASLFLPGRGLLVGAGAQRMVVTGGAAAKPVDVLLRPPRETDPPIVVALPMLLRRAIRSSSQSAPP